MPSNWIVSSKTSRLSGGEPIVKRQNKGSLKLALGTAQFGLPYGISNQRGQPTASEMGRILNMAHQQGISLLDTAPAYGDCEARLGEYGPMGETFSIVTKAASFAQRASFTVAEGLRLQQTFSQSLEHLRCSSVYGLLLHDAEALFKPGAGILIQHMQDLMEKRKVQKIGVSVYSGAQIDQALRLFKPDIIQVPVNVFDQRLIASGHLKRLKQLGVEIHARSIFLQGLLLMEPGSLPADFGPFQPFLNTYKNYISEKNISRLNMSLGFLRTCPEIDYALVGVNSSDELQNVVTAMASSPPAVDDYKRFASTEERLINPSLWKVAS